jgi:hypothetical protein
VTAFALGSGKLAAPSFDVEALAKLIALRREIEADAEAICGACAQFRPVHQVKKEVQNG